jgi:hypothetical protein
MRRRALPILMLVLLLAVTMPHCQEAPYPTDVTAQTLADEAELSRLQSPANLFFEEGFEDDACLDKWYNRIGEKDGLVRVVTGGEGVRSGTRALRLDAVDRDGRSSAAGVTYWFHPGHSTVYFRRYIRFGDDYDQGNLNHVGGSLYAVAGADRWAQMGKAGIRPEGDDRFGASFEPWRDWGRNSPPGAMMLYTYWMDMKRDRDGHYWGNNLMPPKERGIVIERGRWYCLEHMIKANAPGQADGEMAAWIDGQLYIHLKGFRWRTSPEVRLKRVGLGLYVHQSRRANTVWYDDVALSTGYIGPADHSQP